MSTPQPYSPGSGLNSFADKPAAFARGEDSPSDYLARCLDTIAAREPEVQAWVTTRFEAARAEAAAADQRYATGAPLSPIDGMPIAVKDVIQTRDMPTKFGSPIFENHETGFDSASVDALRRAGAVILRQDRDHRIRLRQTGTDTQPFRHQQDRRWVVQRQFGRRRRRHGAGGVGQPSRRLGDPAGRLLRQLRHEADPRRPAHGRRSRPQPTAFGGACRQFAGHVGGGRRNRRACRRRPWLPWPLWSQNSWPQARPRRLIFVETEGWAKCDNATRGAFEKYLAQLRDKGVEIVTRGDSQLANDLDVKISDAVRLCRLICSFELRWLLRQYRETGMLSDELAVWVEMAENMTMEDYRTALASRAHMRQALAQVAPTADAFITLACVGPAPDVDFKADSGEPEYAYLTGDPAFNAATSALGAPAITLPKMALDGMPLGVQVIGAPHRDWELANLAAWLDSEVPSLAL